MVKPKRLSRHASEAWDRVIAECAAKKIDCSQKYDVLERYAVTYQFWLTCKNAIDKEGQIVEGERNPRMVDYHQLTVNLGRIRNELGLGPLASLKMREHEDDDTVREKVKQPRRRRLKILRTG